ncbi:hypothetical protein HZ326_28707 [Fusarium oxysporum f. sp. albedinis]|nr:hypothetical protein HZ326_28707 [Fusarium oxysporum f. sp. albedinis]
MTTSQSLTFLGLGNMGSALVQALLKASHKVTIWNRTTARPQVKVAVEAGAILEADVQNAISMNNIIIICLLDYSSIKNHGRWQTGPPPTLPNNTSTERSW